MDDTLKGNLIVGQSGGPTAVINSSLVGVIREAKKHPEIDGIYGAIHGIEGVLSENLVDLRREDEITLEGIMRTPSAALGSCRHKVTPGEYDKILDVFKKYNIRYFFYIGGNDSADTSHKIGKLAKESGYELRVIGIPKTIDNDLAITDHSPGYGSVARFIAIATMDAGKDTEAIGIVDKVKVIEAMGRNAGWITAASALGKKSAEDPPHLIYVPERPIGIDKMLKDVKEVYDSLGHVVIVICEGAKDESGNFLSASSRAIDVDAFGHKQLGGAADALCKLISGNLGLKARFDKPGTIQRMSMVCVSEVDLKEAYMVGEAAVRYAAGGETDKMVILVRETGPEYRCTTGLADLEEIANAEKKLPDEFINAEGNFVTQKFIDYAMPLIGGPLPVYMRLRKYPIALA
ncbi:MAG TPA: 6-phosphofructokinase [Firmicutes bacterium]|nr:6-phosphofructokinase [Bacillota bacterium]